MMTDPYGYVNQNAEQNNSFYSFKTENGGAGWAEFDYNSTASTAQMGDAGIGGAAGYGGYPPNMFIPSAPLGLSQFTTPLLHHYTYNNKVTDGTGKMDDYDYENEPPLLQELGVNFDHIRQKTLAVLNPFGMARADVIADQDLAGPLIFCLLLGASLLLHGKSHFGHIYGIGLVGCVGMYVLLNLMASDQRSISFTCTASVLGYCLLPMALLSMLAAVLSLQGTFGYVIATSAVIWCGSSSSKLFTITLSMEGQKLLVAYPCTLLYGVFALLAIF